jgi:hypothetical protein
MSLMDKSRCHRVETHLTYILHVVYAQPLDESDCDIMLGACIGNEFGSIRKESEISYTEQC